MNYHRIAIASTLVPLVFAVLGTIAWATGSLWLASLSSQYIPMAPSTALAFLQVSGALFVLLRGRGSGARETVRGAALLVLVLASLKLLEVVGGVTVLNLEAHFVATPGRFGEVPLARMSPVTAAALAVVAVALMCLTQASRASRDVAGLLGGGVTLLGATVALGYAYGAPLLYGGTVVPVALTTGLSLVGTGVAVIAIAGPTGLPLRGVVHDPDRVLLAEQLHRELQDRATYTLTAAGVGIWEVDLSTGATYWSDVISSMFGLPAKARVTALDDFRNRIHPDDRSTVEATLSQPVEHDAPYSLQFRALWDDGRVRWLSSKVRVVRADGGAPLRLLGVTLDVTDRKELERRVEQSQKMEALGQLAGGIAHDFNNVLSVVIGFSDLILATLPPGDPCAADISEIRKAGESGQRLTRQLLAFSRQHPLTPAQIDVNAVIKSSEPILQRLAGDGVRVETALTASSPTVWTDVGQLQQVLVNLTVNARDAMPGGGRLVIETVNASRAVDAALPHTDVTAEHQVIIRVTDTGCGMAPEVCARVFEPLFTTKPADKGTGLGLSTVYGIVRQSGGAIEVASRPGEGTTFQVYLPVAAGHLNLQSTAGHSRA